MCKYFKFLFIRICRPQKKDKLYILTVHSALYIIGSLKNIMKENKSEKIIQFFYDIIIKIVFYVLLCFD
jgi:hypothetical protein